MLRKIIPAVTSLLFLAVGPGNLAAETLSDALRTADVPAQQFTAAELGRNITSYAIGGGGTYLLAYYTDDGSGTLQPPLHVIRYDRAKDDLRRADLRDAHALFQGAIPMDCLGSADAIREYRGVIYIDTHVNPSAGCVIVLNSELSLKAALSGWLIGLLGSDYAILRGSEVHFMSVHPMHIEVYDLKRNRLAEVYPYSGDPQRREFSRLIEPLISRKWCMEYYARCDPEIFDTNLKGNVAVNETSRAFGFEAQFDAAGFGETVLQQVPPRVAVYVFRERAGTWEHRQFEPGQFKRLFGGMSIEELVSRNPDLAFARAAGK